MPLVQGQRRIPFVHKSPTFFSFLFLNFYRNHEKPLRICWSANGYMRVLTFLPFAPDTVKYSSKPGNESSLHSSVYLATEAPCRRFEPLDTRVSTFTARGLSCVACFTPESKLRDRMSGRKSDSQRTTGREGGRQSNFIRTI